MQNKSDSLLSWIGLSSIAGGRAAFRKLVKQFGLPVNLELKGLAKQLSGKYFVRED